MLTSKLANIKWTFFFLNIVWLASLAMFTSKLANTGLAIILQSNLVAMFVNKLANINYNIVWLASLAMFNRS